MSEVPGEGTECSGEGTDSDTKCSLRSKAVTHRAQAGSQSTTRQKYPL